LCNQPTDLAIDTDVNNFESTIVSLSSSSNSMLTMPKPKSPSKYFQQQRQQQQHQQQHPQYNRPELLVSPTSSVSSNKTLDGDLNDSMQTLKIVSPCSTHKYVCPEQKNFNNNLQIDEDSSCFTKTVSKPPQIERVNSSSSININQNNNNKFMSKNLSPSIDILVIFSFNSFYFNIIN
jgi:hypothetical protein